MYLALTFFIISFAGIGVMILNKMRHLNTGRGYINIASHVDDKIRAKGVVARKVLTEFPKHFSREAMHFGIRQGVTGYRKVKAKVYPKIAHIVDAVKGKDVPKNRGKASFFLKNIQDSKENKGE